MSNALLDLARAEVKMGDFAIAPVAALKDGNCYLRAQEYRRLAGGRMMAIGKSDVSQKIPASTYLVSRKIDGEFCLMLIEGSSALLVNPGGTVRIGLPFLNEACALLSKTGIKKALIAGELYVERPDGKRARCHDVGRVARQPDSIEDVKSLRFAVFDILELDGKPASPIYSELWKLVVKIFDSGKGIRPVETVTLKTTGEIEKQFEKWVEEENAEGLVARSDTAGVFKVKPRHSIDAAVVGFTESTEDRQGMLHDMLVALMRNDGTFHLLGRVGGGFTEDQRRAFLSDLKDLACESEFAEINPDHVAYQMVKPEWVVELSCLDFISQTTRGAAIERMVLNYDRKIPKYEPVRRLPLVSPISPQFVRRREDKRAVASDLRIQQVADLVEVALADKDARQMTLAKTEIIKREVYTKVLKGQTMVRKLMLWKTNKESAGNFPAYVAYVTDFSPNRKTPLEREVRVSNSREQIDTLYTALAAEYVVKGWNKA